MRSPILERELPYAGGTDLPEMLKICGQHRPRQDAALQHFREPNRMATVRWGVARKSMEPARDYFLMKGRREMPMVENLYKELLAQGKDAEAAELLTSYTRDFFGATVLRWDELNRRYWKDNWKGF